MRRLVTILLGVGIVGTIAYFATTGNTLEVVNTVETIEKEVIVDALEVKIKEAQEAAKVDIEAKAKGAYDAAYKHEMKTIEARVLEEVEVEIKARRTGVEKETGAYWLSEANVRQLIRATFPDDYETAIAVAMAESRLNPKASNWKDSHRGCNGSFGIFQIGCVHEQNIETLYDVEANIKLARAIYDDSKARTGNGWLPWGAYTDKNYLRYLAMR